MRMRHYTRDISSISCTDEGAQSLVVWSLHSSDSAGKRSQVHGASEYLTAQFTYEVTWDQLPSARIPKMCGTLVNSTDKTLISVLVKYEPIFVGELQIIALWF
jgi:hypothetical protein